MTNSQKKLLHVCAAICIGIFVIIESASAWQESLTYDEIVDIEEGVNAWKQKTFTEPYNPPFIRELATLPIMLGFIDPQSPQYPSRQMFPVRAMIILMSALLLITIYSIGSKWFGSTAGLIAMILTALYPDVLAHSHYVTHDAPPVLFFFLGVAILLKMLKTQQEKKWFILFGLVFALIATTKITGLFFFVITFLILLGTSYKPFIMHMVRNNKKALLMSVGITFFVIWSIYFFQTDVVIRERKDETRVSSRWKAWSKEHNVPILASFIYVLETQPIPLGTYIATLKNNALRIRESPQIFFLGDWYASGRWYFLLINIFFKTPIAFLILLVYSIVIYFMEPKKNEDAKILLVIIGALFFAGSLVGLEPRTRYLLPVVPFIALFVGNIISQRRSKYAILFIVLCVVWYGYSSLRQFPHFISYTNEFIGTKQKPYTLFIDSNFDWGQNFIDIAAYIEKENFSHVSLSYFGRDNGDEYGLISNREYGSHIYEDICAFHELSRSEGNGESVILISSTNWHTCGYKTMKEFFPNRVHEILGDTILVFQKN